MVVMKPKALYVNLMGATNLEDVRRVFDMKVYAVASISEGTANSQKQKTAVDINGKINPTWNCPMQFTINESAAQQTLVFHLRCHRTVGDKSVGEVLVPIKDLLSFMGKENHSVLGLRWPVTSTSGEFQGELTFLYSFNQITNPPPPPPPQQQRYNMKSVAGIVVNVAVHAVGCLAFDESW